MHTCISFIKAMNLLCCSSIEAIPVEYSSFQSKKAIVHLKGKPAHLQVRLTFFTKSAEISQMAVK